MIVDSHCHAWNTWPYKPFTPDPQTRGSVEQLLFEMDRHNVDRAVVVAACIDDTLDNNRYVGDATARHPDRLIPFLDIDSRWSVDYHASGASGRLIAAVAQWDAPGFTHYLADENDNWLTSGDGRVFFAAAADKHLIASLSAGPAWFEDLGRVAEDNPDLPIVLHHLGMVRGIDGTSSESLRRLLELAAQPNIIIKASGFYYGSREMAEYPYLEQVGVFAQIYEAFGAQRLTWGSDFPVSPWAACTYTQSMNVVQRHCTFMTASDIDWVMGGTMATLLETRRPVRGGE